MFTWIWSMIKGTWEVFWTALVVVFDFFRGWLAWIVSSVVIVIAATQSTVTFLFDLWGNIFTRIGWFSSHSHSQPGWGGIGDALAFANTFFPLSETFAMLTVTLHAIAIAIIIRFFRTLRALVPFA